MGGVDTWEGYLRALTDGDPQVEIARRSGVGQTVISKWLTGKTVGKPGNVAAVVVAYGGNVLEAFVAAGYIKAEEAGLEGRLIEPDLRSVPNDELAAEVTRRLVDSPKPRPRITPLEEDELRPGPRGKARRGRRDPQQGSAP